MSEPDDDGWVQETWESEEDIKRDLLLLAEFSVPSQSGKHLEPVPVPDTILQYRKRMAENKLKPLNSDIDESVSYVVSGRGRGIKDRIIRPGEIFESHPSDDVQLAKDIREVSGMGYSNQLIEESIKAKVYESERNTLPTTSHFKFVPSSSSKNKSSTRNTSKYFEPVDVNLSKDNFPPLK